MTPEKQQLIDDLFFEHGRGETALLTGRRRVRRRRRWRIAERGMVLVTVAAMVLLWVERKGSAPPPPEVSKSSVKPVAPPQPRSLTDEELLSLFPHTPVALGTLPDGRKVLIFPRPGDEARFVTRL